MPWKEGPDLLWMNAFALSPDCLRGVDGPYKAGVSHISRKTGYKISDRYKECGPSEGDLPTVRGGLTATAISCRCKSRRLFLNLKQDKPHWGAIREKLLLPLCERSQSSCAKHHPHAVLDRRWSDQSHAAPTGTCRGGTALSLGLTDYIGEFLLGNKKYCYPLTVTGSRFALSAAL